MGLATFKMQVYPEIGSSQLLWGMCSSLGQSVDQGLPVSRLCVLHLGAEKDAFHCSSSRTTWNRQFSSPNNRGCYNYKKEQKDAGQVAKQMSITLG